jgi:exosortase
MATVLIDGGRFLLPDGTQREDKRLLFFGLWLILTAALLWKPVEALVRYSLGNDNASHIVLIPFISAWLLYFEQKRIFERVSSDYVSGAVLLLAAAGVALWTLRSAAAWTETQALSGYTLALVLLWAGGFALIFGRVAMGKARFALLFLLLMIPPPDSWLNYSVYLLQKGSADIAEFIFDLAGVPALRDGFVFHLAHLSIEVAKECSGIRSSLALLILALLVGHLFLRTFWKQAVFVVVGLVIMIVKNGIRIATLTILAQYVDSGFLYGRLHHEGGVVFFLIGLVLLLPVFWLLQRGETPRTAVQDAAAG